MEFHAVNFVFSSLLEDTIISNSFQGMPNSTWAVHVLNKLTGLLKSHVLQIDVIRPQQSKGAWACEWTDRMEIKIEDAPEMDSFLCLSLRCWCPPRTQET